MTDKPHPGMLIRRARLSLGLTQARLADMLHVTAKAVSKWERSAGQPDASLIPDLSRILGLSNEALLTGQTAHNLPDGGNMKRIRFYQCPQCGNLLTATGPAEINCCARRLTPMSPVPADEAHRLQISDVETEKLIRFTHPMDKGHHLTFVTAIGYDRVQLVRLYAEGGQELRLPRIPWATYACGCSDAPETLFISKEERTR